MRLFAIAALAVSAIAVPAAAQTTESPAGFQPQVSASVGFSRFVDGSEDFNGQAATGRVTARFHRNFGVEADASLGLVESDIGGYDFKMSHNVAAYAVGYFPLSEKVDLIGRVGYGTTEFEISDGVVTVNDSYSGWTAGVGGQYFFDDKNGIRMDVTRHEYEELEGGFDSVSIMYVRNF